MPATPIANLVVGEILREVFDRAYFKSFERRKLEEKKAAAAALNEMVSHIVIDVVDHVVHEEPVENCLIPVEETIIPSPKDKVLDFFDRMQDPTEDTEEVETESTEESEDELLEEVNMEDESSVIANIGSSTRQSFVSDDESEAGNSSPEPEVVNISSDEETNDDVDTSTLITPELLESSNNIVPTDETSKNVEISTLITPELTELSNCSFAPAKVSASVQTEMSTFNDASAQTEALSCDATVQFDTFRQSDQATQFEPEGLVATNVPLEVCQLSKIAKELEKSGTVNQLTVRK
jgi:hypothetical protein